MAADIGTLAHLPKITSNNSLARELAYTGRSFSALEAEKLGLLSKVVNGGREEVVQAALDLAKFIATKSPVAVSGTKQLLIHSRDHSVTENLEYTSVWNGAMIHTDVRFIGSRRCSSVRCSCNAETFCFRVGCSHGSQS